MTDGNRGEMNVYFHYLQRRLTADIWLRNASSKFPFGKLRMSADRYTPSALEALSGRVRISTE